MKNIKVKCPAKINLTLEVVNRRNDGFHNINSVMQLISLYDYLNISIQKADKTNIILNGNNSEIPYNEKNLVYKASELFLTNACLNGYEIQVYIEKNIPIAAGLAGGSTDAAGTLLGLNTLFNNIFTNRQLHELCAQLGSDLNVCLEGGCLLATSRGENIKKLPYIKMPVTLIKPKYLGISAKEAYTKYALKEYKPNFYNTEKMIDALKSKKDIRPFLYNDLEYAVYDDYNELQTIKKAIPDSIMSGSGSTYFVLKDIQDIEFSKDFQLIKNLEFISGGCAIV